MLQDTEVDSEGEVIQCSMLVDSEGEVIQCAMLVDYEPVSTKEALKQ